MQIGGMAKKEIIPLSIRTLQGKSPCRVLKAFDCTLIKKREALENFGSFT